MKLRCIGVIWVFILTLMIGSACSVLESPDTIGVDCQSHNIVPGADLRNCDLGDTELSYADLEGANLQGANLRNASLFKANFKQADLRGVNLDDTPLVWVNFTEANLQGASLVGASLQTVNFRNADLTDANLRNAELIDVDFTGANLTGANRTNVTVSRVKLPDGTMVNKGWGEPEPGSTSAFNRATRGPEKPKEYQTAESMLWIFGWILGALGIALIVYFLPKKIAKRNADIVTGWTVKRISAWGMDISVGQIAIFIGIAFLAYNLLLFLYFFKDNTLNFSPGTFLFGVLFIIFGFQNLDEK